MAIPPLKTFRRMIPQSPWASALNTLCTKDAGKTFLCIKFDSIEFVVPDNSFQNYILKHQSDTIQHNKYIFTVYKTPVERYISQVSQPYNTCKLQGSENTNQIN